MFERLGPLGRISPAGHSSLVGHVADCPTGVKGFVHLFAVQPAIDPAPDRGIKRHIQQIDHSAQRQQRAQTLQAVAAHDFGTKVVDRPGFLRQIAADRQRRCPAHKSPVSVIHADRQIGVDLIGFAPEIHPPVGHHDLTPFQKLLPQGIVAVFDALIQLVQRQLPVGIAVKLIAAMTAAADFKHKGRFIGLQTTENGGGSAKVTRGGGII